jgi:hypothetical protein
VEREDAPRGRAGQGEKEPGELGEHGGN